MSDVRMPRPGALPFAGLEADRWGLVTPGPGLRDLGSLEPWERSLSRSLRRRELAAARRPGLPQSATARLAAAVVAATALAPAAEVASAATVTTTSVDPLLRNGSAGAGVRAVQAALGIPADGVFGPATKSAVRAFQRAHGLTIDGIAGPVTLAALGLGSSGTATTTAASARAATTDAKLPAVPGALATSVQRALGVTADGVFGPLSRAALRSYQSAHGLTADGVPGPRTLAALGLTSATARSAPASPAGTTAASGSTTTASTTGTGVSAAVAAARSKIGSPYVSGGSGPSSFDCSGLTQWAMRQAGIELPRTSYAQYGVGTAVSHDSVQAGDLVFFTTDGPGASHVGIATGPGTAISATTHGVMEHSTTSGYWGQHYLGARRVA